MGSLVGDGDAAELRAGGMGDREKPIANFLAIEAMAAADWPAVRAIYQAGIETNLATFETTAPVDWEDWSAGKRADCRLVARANGRVIGWAALSPASKRPVYAGVAEVSVYVDPAARGQGVGDALLGALVSASEAAGIWTLTASIFPENTPSIRLHEKHGFRILGRRERIGRHHGIWRDTVLMERRSQTAGR